jgi:ABC-type multidrug transport system fused ATPase/permease subunit
MKHPSHLHSKTGTSSCLSSLSSLSSPHPYFVSCFHLLSFHTPYSFPLTSFTFNLTPLCSLTLPSIIINFPSGKLGRPVIQIEGVTFGYASKNESKCPSLPLFADVHLGIEQSSRIALVGPNGSGKVRCTCMIIVLDSKIYLAFLF